MTHTTNLNNISAACALQGRTILIEDTYKNEEFDLSGPKGFDKKHNYYSKCFLNVPMKDHKNKVIGVLQLLNPKEGNELIIYNNAPHSFFDRKYEEFKSESADAWDQVLTFINQHA